LAAPQLCDNVMKALSIKQPWVWAILHAGKDVENRSWQRSHRGWLALHASGQPRRGAVMPRGIHCPELKTLDYSAICGVARVVDMRTTSRSKWMYRPDDGSINYGWILAEVTALPKPIACKGALGLWTVAPTIAAAIRRQLPSLDLSNE